MKFITFLFLIASFTAVCVVLNIQFYDSALPQQAVRQSTYHTLPKDKLNTIPSPPVVHQLANVHDNVINVNEKKRKVAYAITITKDGYICVLIILQYFAFNFYSQTFLRWRPSTWIFY